MSKRGIRVWEVIVLVVVIGVGLVVFVQAAERVRWKGHAAVPTAHMQDILAGCEKYRAENKRWPMAATDIRPYLTLPQVAEGLAEGWYVVLWDRLPGDDPDAVLIYEKRVPEGFGYVCHRDGKIVRIMTTEEAKAALGQARR